MASSRKPGSRKRGVSAYERRIQSYLERHPGATRQEARGHRPPKGTSEYRERVRRAEARGKRGAEARGKAGAVSRARFLAYIREGDLVQMANHVRHVTVDSRGRLVGIVKMVIPPRRPVRVFELAPLTRSALARLIREEERRGAVLTPIPSLDQRRLVTA